MKKNKNDIIKAGLILLVIIIFTKMIDSLPWWSFVIPVSLVGLLSTFLRWKIPVFTVGFSVGFIVWFGANFYFDVVNGGIILEKVGAVLAVPKIVVLFASGIIGGIMTWLALYIGQSMFSSGGDIVEFEDIRQS